MRVGLRRLAVKRLSSRHLAVRNFGARGMVQCARSIDETVLELWSFPPCIYPI